MTRSTLKELTIMTSSDKGWRSFTIAITFVLLLWNTRLPAENWATVNKSIPNMPQIIQSLRETKGNVVRLKPDQTKDILSALAGSVKESFSADYLSADIWAAWLSRTNNQETYLIRLSADRQRCVYIGINTSGTLIESGNGRISEGKIPDLNFPIKKLPSSIQG